MIVTYGAPALVKQPYAPWLYDHEEQSLDEMTSVRQLALPLMPLHLPFDNRH